MIRKIRDFLDKRLGIRFKLIFEGIFVGLAVGIVIVSFRYLLDLSDLFRANLYVLLKSGPWWITICWFLLLVLIGLVLGQICLKEPLIGGSGIPQVKGILLGRIKVKWLPVLIGKFCGSVLAAGAGLSLGRGAPSIQLGAAVAQGLSRILGRLRLEEKYLITSGAAAGLAAAFNAPLAGVVFVLEEIHKGFSPILLSCTLAAALTSDFISQYFFGQRPIFYFENLPTLPLNHYLYLIALGFVVGIFGLYFNYCLLKSLDFYNKLRIAVQYRQIIPLIIAGIIGFFLPETLGGGQNLINTLGSSSLALSTLVVLVLVKFYLTMISYGSGAPGGLFIPLLVTGALAGNIFGIIVIDFFHVEAQYLHNFIILSMAAYLTAIVKAPISGAILITEMSGSFSHFLATSTVCLSAYLISDLFKSQPIYEVLLKRMLVKQGDTGYVGDNHNKAIIEIPICLGSGLDRKRVKILHGRKTVFL